ncbi:hypothetical protein CEUSTIGMA_g5774.t1 [Chlamydomonas eustigma]|uniref:Ribosomal protein L19 n=1 Tax=Chlamydomonas eustigma TaxID=1157962 RepID=A0A250X608_9CHLO|nr:hypothetical protein CEUSTIGMA_g5774.t1 [Chlamydomonas eustigma]|eukprot:GAX78332.1 hypothetical protein CEUSTIGMA_g5774.t1 [Chlamydomonas eustigma]
MLFRSVRYLECFGQSTGRSFNVSALLSEIQVTQNSNIAVSSEASPSWPVQPQRQSVTAQYKPWEQTRFLARKSGYQRRMRFLMQTLEEEQVQTIQKIRDFPDFKSGDILEVQMIVPENQKKMYLYRGVCISRSNKGIRSSFKIYNVFPDGGPVVQHIPLYMPDLVSIKVVGHTPTGSRMKKYHILEDVSSKYTFQKQVVQLKIPSPV